MPTPNFINILASACFMDASGALMEKGSLTVTAVDASGKSVPFHVGGGGVALVHTITRAITDGSMVGTLQLANPAAADISVGYTFVITDSATFETTTFDAVALTADEDGNFDLSELQAGSYAQAVPVVYATGPQGVAATVTVGTTTTLAAGAQATVTNSGTSSAAVFNFGIPQGDPGTGGDGSETAVTATTPLSITSDVISIPPATDSVDGYLTHADHVVFHAKQDALGFTPLDPANNLSELTPSAARTHLGLATVAATGSYNDLTSKPSIPAAQVNSDWNASSGVTQILNKPTLTSGTVTSVTSADGNATVATGTSTPVITIVSAPKLATPRNINGVAFDGTSAITVPAAASTLTGTALPVGVIVPAAQVSGLATIATSGLTLTTTGSSGAATITGTTLNIPQYAGGGGSMVYPGAGMAVSTGTAWGASLTAPTGAIVGISDTQTLTNKSIVATQLTGTLQAGQHPALTGDVNNTAGSLSITVTKVNGVAFSGLATGILKNTTATGVPSIAIASDFPTLNQNTTGSAAKLTTARAINGVNFDGTAAITVAAAAGTLTGTALPVAVIVPAAQVSGTFTSSQLPSNALLDSISFTVDGGGSAPSTGSKGFTMVPYACTLTAVTLLADVAGSCVIDIKKSAYSGFPTTTSITASALPTLSAVQKNQDSTLTGWTKSISAGDTLEFVINSASTLTRVNLILTVTRT